MKRAFDRREAWPRPLAMIPLAMIPLAMIPLAMISAVGCGRGVDNGGAIGDDPAADAARSEPGDGQRRADSDQAAGAVPLDEPAEPELPQVVLSEAHAAMLLVKVGQKLPDATLPDLEGNQQSLAGLFGERLTVVLFWSSDSIYSTVALEDLAADVAAAYADRGVRVVGINVSDTSEAAKQAAGAAQAAFPNLLDQDGSFLSRVSTGRPPLLYLLDNEGKVIWLDIEYSRETRRLLGDAIAFVLQEASGVIGH
ncbi:MAG: redoxin family protein [Pirellulales bacterium]